MKKLVAAVLIVALLVVAPWGIGKLAEKRINTGLDRVVEVAPYLGIVHRKYTVGWFRSEQEVTFEVLGPLRLVATPARFTVRNEILHGPVLGLSGLGLARVNSRLVIDEKTRRELVKFVGTDEIVRVSTRIGFFGSATTTFSGDARTLEPEGGGTISWDDFDLDVTYSRDLDSFELAGDWPRFESKEKNGTRFLVSDMTLDGEAERIKGDLYDSDLELTIDTIRIVGADQGTTEVSDILYVVETSDDGDFTSIATRVGAGAVESQQLDALGVKLKAVHYDFTLRRLHTATLVKFLETIKDSYGKPALATPTISTAILDPIKEQAFELLKREPEFVIDRIGIETPEGEGYIKGVIRLRGVTEQDLKMGALSLIGKIDADLTFEAPQKMLEKIQGGSTAVGVAVDAGYAERKGDKLVSKLEFHDGELRINGKVQGIPGLGGPPAGPE